MKNLPSFPTVPKRLYSKKWYWRFKRSYDVLMWIYSILGVIMIGLVLTIDKEIPRKVGTELGKFIANEITTPLAGVIGWPASIYITFGSLIVAFSLKGLFSLLMMLYDKKCKVCGHTIQHHEDSHGNHFDMCKKPKSVKMVNWKRFWSKDAYKKDPCTCKEFTV